MATPSVAVLDATGQLVSNGDTQIIAVASVPSSSSPTIRCWPRPRAKSHCVPRVTIMRWTSCCSHPTMVRRASQDGGNAVVTRRAPIWAQVDVPPSDGWWNTISSAPDPIRYYDMLLDGSGNYWIGPPSSPTRPSPHRPSIGRLPAVLAVPRRFATSTGRSRLQAGC